MRVLLGARPVAVRAGRLLDPGERQHQRREQQADPQRRPEQRPAGDRVPAPRAAEGLAGLPATGSAQVGTTRSGRLVTPPSLPGGVARTRPRCGRARGVRCSPFVRVRPPSAAAVPGLPAAGRRRRVGVAAGVGSASAAADVDVGVRAPRCSDAASRRVLGVRDAVGVRSGRGCSVAPAAGPALVGRLGLGRRDALAGVALDRRRVGQVLQRRALEDVVHELLPDLARAAPSRRRSAVGVDDRVAARRCRSTPRSRSTACSRRSRRRSCSRRPGPAYRSCPRPRGRRPDCGAE